MCYPTLDTMTITREDFLTFARIVGKPSKKRVRFSSFNSSSESKQAKDDLKELWYSPHDLAAFKFEARKLSAALASGRKTEESLRGFENSSLERLMYRHMTIQCVVSAHKKQMSPRQIAEMSRKCTQWNEEVAFFQACHDYCDVYQPAALPSLPKVPTTAPQFPFQLKRAAQESPSSCRRRVRRRLSPSYKQTI